MILIPCIRSAKPQIRKSKGHYLPLTNFPELPISIPNFVKLKIWTHSFLLRKHLCGRYRLRFHGQVRLRTAQLRPSVGCPAYKFRMKCKAIEMWSGSITLEIEHSVYYPITKRLKNKYLLPPSQLNSVYNSAQTQSILCERVIVAEMCGDYFFLIFFFAIQMSIDKVCWQLWNIIVVCTSGIK